MKIKLSMEMIGPSQWSEIDSGYGQETVSSHCFEVDFDDDTNQHEMIASVLQRLLCALDMPRKSLVLARLVEEILVNEDLVAYEGRFCDVASLITQAYKDIDDRNNPAT